MTGARRIREDGMELTTKRVTFTGGNSKAVKEIYTASFAKKDRMPFVMMQLMACLPSTEFLSFYDADTLCGFVYMATLLRISFVMFFAVDERLRSKGYGSRILDAVQAQRPNDKHIITIERCDETDAPDIEDRIRRKRFYLRNGYSETGYMIKLGNAEQEIIIKNGEFDKQEFRRFFLLYSNGTMWPKMWQAGASTVKKS